MIDSSKPQVGDLRIKLQRTARFEWQAIAERYKKGYQVRDDWTAVISYKKGWHKRPFRWMAVLAAERDALKYRKQLEKERKRRSYEKIEYLKV